MENQTQNNIKLTSQIYNHLKKGALKGEIKKKKHHKHHKHTHNTVNTGNALKHKNKK